MTEHKYLKGNVCRRCGQHHDAEATIDVLVEVVEELLDAWYSSDVYDDPVERERIDEWAGKFMEALMVRPDET